MQTGECSDLVFSQFNFTKLLGYKVYNGKNHLIGCLCRQAGEMTRLFYDAGLIVLVGFISPYKEDRDFARSLIGEDFIEVFVDCPIEECEKRDVKGLYAKAREGLIENFTGVNDPYEVPENAEIVVNTKDLSVEESVDKIMEYLNGLVK